MPHPTSRSRSRSRGRVLVFLVSLALAAAGCKTQPLVDPRPIRAAATPAQTRAAILRALMIDRRYAVVSEQPGEIVARFAQADWAMVVAIGYSNEVSVRYLDSDGIDYAISEGVPVIHSGYNKRVQQLSDWIAKEIAISRVSTAPLEVAAPPLSEGTPE